MPPEQPSAWFASFFHFLAHGYQKTRSFGSKADTDSLNSYVDQNAWFRSDLEGRRIIYIARNLSLQKNRASELVYLFSINPRIWYRRKNR